MVNYYDGVLCCIGTLMVAGAVTAALFGAGSIIPFAVPALLLIGHALFIAPPVEEVKKSVVSD